MFSVILPTYNRAAMLAGAMRSVLAQTFEDWECFVLDDGSNDNTPRVFEELGGDPRFRLHRFDDNRRQHVRRNFAIRRSRGTFVTFLDSDDLWVPERLERFAVAAAARPSVGFWFSNSWLLRHGRIVGLSFDPRRVIVEGRVPGWFAVGSRRLPYVTTNVAIRREAFEGIGHFREDMKILEDTELYARMLAAGLEVGCLREPLSIRRLHEGQITHDHQVDFEESLLALQSGGAPPAVLEEEKARLVVETAMYFVKALAPAKARAFLAAHRERGPGRRTVEIVSRIPLPLLHVARTARTWFLRLRHHPSLASPEAERARRLAAALAGPEHT